VGPAAKGQRRDGEALRGRPGAGRLRGSTTASMSAASGPRTRCAWSTRCSTTRCAATRRSSR
jgi:hypothetical protein